METKVELRIFSNVKECQIFINEFSENKKVVRKEVIPIANICLNNITFMVFLEYL